VSDRFRSPASGLRSLEVGELADFAQLVQFPGWVRLRDHYEAMIAKQKEDWGEALLTGSPPDETEVAFKAGFWAGVIAVLDTPSRAETRLAREIQRRKDVA
jgi:hypothetical protein